MNKDRWISYGIDAFLASLFTFGCAQSFLISVFLQISFITTFFWSTLFCVVLLILLWNQRTIILLLPSLAVLVYLYTRYYLPIDWWWTTSLPFLSWLPTLIKGGAVPHPEYLLPVTILVAAVFSLPTTLMIRYKFRFTTLFIFMSLLIGTEWVLNHHEIIAVLPFMIFTMVMVYIRSNYQMYIKKLKVPSFGITWQLWFIPIILLATILPVFLTTPNPAVWKWPYLAETVDRINKHYTRAPAPKLIPAIYSIKNTGFLPLNNRLGGNVAPDHQLQLLVQAPFPINLRGSIQNEYNGKAWKDTTLTKTYAMNQQTKDTQKSFLYDPDLPQRNLFRPRTYDKYIQPTSLKIKTAALGTSTLFTPSQTSEILITPPSTLLPFFNTQGEIFTQQNIISGTEYTLQFRYFVTPLESFTNFVNLILRNTSIVSDPQEEIYKKDYTQLPANYSSAVTEIAKSITRNQETDYDKIAALEQYFENYFTYTLQPGTPPEDRDFVEYFLETKEGYCTYYATALTVMARTLGIPARYVEGFSLPSSANADGFYEVTNENAHAWTEVYFHGIGWIPFDPTPPRLPIPTSSPVPTNDSKATIAPTNSSLPESALPLAPEKTPLPSRIQLPFWVIVTTIILAALLILLFLPIAIGRIRYSPYIVKQFIQTPEEIIRYYYHDILQLFKLHKYMLEPGETLLAYSKRVDKHFRFPKDTLYNITEILMEMEFSKYSASMDNAQKVIQFHHNLVLISPKMIKPIQYYKNRYLPKIRK